MPKAPTNAKQRRQASKEKSVKASTDWLKFNSKSTEGQCLSNFADLMVHINGETYFNGEAAFHGEKMKCVARYMPEGPEKKALVVYAARFLGISDPRLAKRMGSAGVMPLSKEQLRPWDTKHAFLTQRAVCHYKCRTYPQIKELLVKSKGRPLLHQDNRARESNVWGGRIDVTTGKFVGQNQLGKIWMQMRDNLCSDATECDVQGGPNLNSKDLQASSY